MRPRYTWLRSGAGTSKSTFFLRLAHVSHFGIVVFCKRQTIFSVICEHSQPDTLSQLSSSKILPNVPFHNNTANGLPWRLHSNGTNGPSTEPQLLGRVDRGSHAQISGQSASGSRSSEGASVISTGGIALIAALASPEHPGSLEIVSNTFAAVIYLTQEHLAP